MKRDTKRMRMVRLTALLLTFGLAGCTTRHAEEPLSKASTAKDRNRVYTEACDLIMPYMKVHGARVRMVNTAKSREEINRGIGLLKQVVEFKPDNWSAFWMMGKAYQALDETDNACDAFEKSFAIQKNNPDVAREYMSECLNLGRVTAGIGAAEHAMKLKPDDAGLVANLALAYLIGGRVDEAIETADKSLTLAPDDKDTQLLKKIILEVQAGVRPKPTSTRDLAK